MDAWWQCEVPYPFVPQEVHQRDRLRPRQPAQSLLRSEGGRRPVRGGHRRVSPVRRPRPERSGGGAPRRDQLAPRRQSAAGRHPRPPDTSGADPQPRHLDIAPKRPGAGRRGVRDGGRHLARPARDRLRQIGRHRDGVEQREPREQHRALLGGDRPHQEGAQSSRRPVQLGGQALHAPSREHLAPPVAAAASPHVVGHRGSRDRGRGRAARPGARPRPARARGHEAGLRGASQGARRAGLAEGDDRQLRLRGLRLRRRHGRRGAPRRRASSSGSSTRASSRLRSTRASCPAPRRPRPRRRSIGRRRRRDRRQACSRRVRTPRGSRR